MGDFQATAYPQRGQEKKRKQREVPGKPVRRHWAAILHSAAIPEINYPLGAQGQELSRILPHKPDRFVRVCLDVAKLSQVAVPGKLTRVDGRMPACPASPKAQVIIAQRELAAEVVAK